MKTVNYKLTHFVLIAILIAIPLAASAAIVPCGGTEPCTLANFLDLLRRLFEFLVYKVMLPLAVLSIAAAGLYYITARGGEQVSKAHNIFYYTVLGMIIALAALLLVNAILLGLGATVANPL